ncbi:MAG: hypothetical protein RL632_1921 [Bacteroidota bacterium]|jgi:hypothetical protein
MKYIFVILTSVLVASFDAYSQEEGQVTIIKDVRLDALVKKQGTPTPPASTPQILGYRVQLFFDSDKQLVDEARSKFIAQFPKVDTYILFTAPNFVLKVGDFRTLLEAERIRESLLREFPTSFVIKEFINLPRIDQE